MSEKFCCPNPFPNDTYDTPEKVRRSIWEYLTFGTRLSFYLRNFAVFIRSGWAAKHTDFPAEIQTKNSLKNFRIVESCGGKIHLEGLEHLSDPSGPFVIISNHMSLLETAILHSFVRPRINFCFVIKQQLLDVPFFGNIMYKLGCIAVGRSNPREDLRIVLEEGARRLKEGVSVIIFPQHSRSQVFDETKFNTIAVKLAKRAGVPVLPLALRTDFLDNGKWIKDLGPVRRERPIHFSFGAPIRITGSGKEEQQQVIDFIETHLTKWGCKIRKAEPDSHAE